MHIDFEVELTHAAPKPVTVMVHPEYAHITPPAVIVTWWFRLAAYFALYYFFLLKISTIFHSVSIIQPFKFGM